MYLSHFSDIDFKTNNIFVSILIFLICKLIKLDFNVKINKNGNSIIILILLLSLARLILLLFYCESSERNMRI